MPPPDSLRLFFALWPPPELTDRLAAIAAEAAARHGGRATRRETIHLTLAFLGQVTTERLPALTDAVHKLRAEPWTLVIDRLGYWPHKQLLWAGCTLPCPALDDFARRLHETLGAAGFASDYGKYPFTPHVTLVRRMPPPPTDSLPEIGTQAWSCHDFVLISSDLSGPTPAYTILDRFALGIKH